MPYVYDYDTGMPIVGAKVTVTSSDGESVSSETDSEGGAEDGGWEIEAESTYAVDISMGPSARRQFSTIRLVTISSRIPAW